jgi:hypothetical protein
MPYVKTFTSMALKTFFLFLMTNNEYEKVCAVHFATVKISFRADLGTVGGKVFAV